MHNVFVCTQCGKKTDPAYLPIKCQCGGLYSLAFSPKSFSIDLLDFSLWRYRSALPFDAAYDGYKKITMGEGLTQIVPLQNDPNLLVKMDFMMPTLSFKDRGAAVLVAKSIEFGARKIVADSSGNAGNSIAAYAGRAGIDCDVFVPKGTSDKKIKMIVSHGATIHIINGTREDTATAALKAADTQGVFYASHVYNPYFYQGTKTYAYEIYEQFAGEIPDTIVIPTGNGTLLLGCYIGFSDLLSLGLIKKLPRLIAVQSQQCCPIYNSFVNKQHTVTAVENLGTLAEGIAIAMPMRAADILEAIEKTNGAVITILEKDILPTREMLAKLGFFVEHTTAATVAGFLPYYNKHKDTLGKCVIPLCGAGLKSEK